jgi:hypothetical protein
MTRMTRAGKAREVVLRRVAARRGFRIERSRRRDPLALGFGRYRILDAATGEVVAGDGPGGYGLDLDAVQEILDKGSQ